MKRLLVFLLVALLAFVCLFAGLALANAPPGMVPVTSTVFTTLAERMPAPVMAVAADVLWAAGAALVVWYLITSTNYNHTISRFILKGARIVRLTLTAWRRIVITGAACGKASWRGWSLPLQTDGFAPI